jgi:hypothetical protein
MKILTGLFLLLMIDSAHKKKNGHRLADEQNRVKKKSGFYPPNAVEKFAIGRSLDYQCASKLFSGNYRGRSLLRARVDFAVEPSRQKPPYFAPALPPNAKWRTCPAVRVAISPSLTLIERTCLAFPLGGGTRSTPFNEVVGIFNRAICARIVPACSASAPRSHAAVVMMSGVLSKAAAARVCRHADILQDACCSEEVIQTSKAEA